MKSIFAICLALVLMLACAAFADESTLVVSGSGTVYMEADVASAALGVSVQGRDLTTLQQLVNAKVNAICDALTQAGLDTKNISTNQIYINPVYDYGSESMSFGMAAASSEAQSYIIGYTIDNTLTIRTEEIDKLGAYIDTAFAAGANNFQYINFGVKDDSAAAKQALELAVQDARAKAETIAAASGKKLGDALEIVEDAGYNNYTTAGAVRYAVAESSAYDKGTTVRASDIEVSASIQITYELE